MFTLSMYKKNRRRVIKESMDYMEIIEYLIDHTIDPTMTEKQARRMFYDLNTKGRYIHPDGTKIELREELF